MIIPDKLKVGGHEYTVIKDHKFRENSNICAQAAHSVLEIRISQLTLSGEQRP